MVKFSTSAEILWTLDDYYLKVPGDQATEGCWVDQSKRDATACRQAVRMLMVANCNMHVEICWPRFSQEQ